MKAQRSHLPVAIQRRHFLGVVVAAGVAPYITLASDKQKMKAAVIGHTGAGDYGHDIDRVFNDRPDIQVVGVADPNAEGRAKAAERCRAGRQYEDYREMLQKERPQLVAVCPRWTDQRRQMVMAALSVGAHVVTEKPFVHSLVEGDELLATARKAGLKIAVAHQMRLAPSVRFLKKAIEAGEIGDLLQIRAQGKQDTRAGGEDMIVLGTHLFDLMRLLAGDPSWCTARILQKGREATLQDARPAGEKIGKVLGNEIEAELAFPRGVMARFTSRGAYRQIAGPFGFELIGSKGVVRLIAGVHPELYILQPGSWNAEGRQDQWQRMKGDPTLQSSADEKAFPAANRRVVDDWLAAIREDREPACSGEAGLRAVEMCMGVFEAGLSSHRISFPLKNRQHPLGA